ncbi:MAG: hypothetical protein ACK4UN_00830 [Limisphaerales bacterium]
MNVLRILLQDEGSKLFLEELDRWTTDPSKALAFHSPFAAALFSHINELHGLKLVFHNPFAPQAAPVTADMPNFPF